MGERAHPWGAPEFRDSKSVYEISYRWLKSRMRGIVSNNLFSPYTNTLTPANPIYDTGTCYRKLFSNIAYGPVAEFRRQTLSDWCGTRLQISYSNYRVTLLHARAKSRKRFSNCCMAWCLTSTETVWLIGDGEKGGRGINCCPAHDIIIQVTVNTSVTVAPAVHDLYRLPYTL